MRTAMVDATGCISICVSSPIRRFLSRDARAVAVDGF
jgi:hypothetical protein